MVENNIDDSDMQTEYGDTDTEIDPVNEHILNTKLAGVAGTSGQEGAGLPVLPRADFEDQATLGDIDGLVTNDAINIDEIDSNGYMESTDENNLMADLGELDSNTHRPDQDEFEYALDASVPINPPEGEPIHDHERAQEFADHHDTDTEYPNHTRKLRESET